MSQLLLDALQKIAEPLKAIREQAIKDGLQINGQIAIQLSTDPNYLKNIAQNALKEYAEAYHASKTPSLPYVGWVEIDVKERLPIESDEYGIIVKNYDTCPGACYFNSETKQWLKKNYKGDAIDVTNKVTHWLEKTQYPHPLWWKNK